MRTMIILATLVLPSAALAQASIFRSYPASVRSLMAAELKLDEQCRGGLGDVHSTDVACNRRSILDRKINDLGWCWGPDDTIEAEKQWVRCGPHAHRES